MRRRADVSAIFFSKIVFHHNVAAASVKSLSCGIDRVAVVAIAAEHTVVAHPTRSMPAVRRPRR